MDGLSAAASGIAVVQLAGQLVNGFIQLYDFWVTVQGAPDDINDLVTELKCLTLLLKEIASEQHHGHGMMIAMQCCEGKVKVLLNIVREFEPNFSSHLRRIRFWNKFKAARSDKRIKKFRDALQEAKTTLILALRPRCHLPPAYVRDPNELDTLECLDSVVNLQKPPALFRSSSDPGVTGKETIKGFDLYADTSIQRTASTPIQGTASKPKMRRSRSSVMSIDDIHDHIRASIESALVLAPSTFFDGSVFAKTMRDIIPLHQSNDAKSNASDTGVSDAPNTSKSTLTRQPANFSQVQHKISATETLFGTVWLRTTTVRAGSCSKTSKGVYEVNSFVYYPSWWLTKFGLTHGVEASLSSSTKGWQFAFNPVRAVPDSSLIFDFCKTGNIEGVKLLIARGDASVRDASPKGWTPLHFAAEAANVELCAYLIEAGADERALAYEGPSADKLSAVTIFAEKPHIISAERKIAMLRLFLDSLDLSEPADDGWTIIAQLSKSQNNENASLASTSIIWFLQQFSTDNMITFGPRTIWHGLQHASRSFLQLAPERMVLQRLEDLMAGRKVSTVKRSHARSIARLVAIRVAGQQCLPMLIVASQILHIEGFDWIGGGAEPDRPLIEKQLPFLFSKWTETLKDAFERSDELIAQEVDATFEKAAWTQNLADISDSKDASPDHGQNDNEVKLCATCGDDYTCLGAGLVEPHWIAFAECTKSEHKSDCTCSELPPSYATSKVKATDHQSDNTANVDQPAERNTETDQQDLRETSESHAVNYGIFSLGQPNDAADDPIETRESGSNCTSDEDENDAECFYDLDDYPEIDEGSVVEALNCDNNDPFKAVAHHLHCAQGRTWIGSYEPGELVCGTCFLRREGYVNEAGKDEDVDYFFSMPEAFGGKVEEE